MALRLSILWVGLFRNSSLILHTSDGSVYFDIETFEAAGKYIHKARTMESE